MNSKKYLAEHRRTADKFLKEFFAKKRKEAKKIDPLAVKVLNSLEEYIAGGKKVRGALTLLGYQAAGGKKKKDIIPVSAAVEIIHSSLLIHDDFIDKDKMRRGKPTVHELYSKQNSKHYGASIALMIGDVGFFLSHQLIANSRFETSKIVKAMSELERLLINTGYGEVLDIAFDFKEKITWDDMLKVRLYKTAHYTFVLPLTIGTTLGEAKKGVFKAIKDYGESVGLAFQIRDDILGVFGDPEITGKSNESDIKEGKKTLLYTKALEMADRKGRDFIKKWYGSRALTKRKIEKIRKIIKNSGALNYSSSLAEELVEKGKRSIPEITKSKKYQEIFSSLADYIVKREK